MREILCIYYSRTGNTKKTMEELAQALDGEVAALEDGVDRSGWRGFLRSGMDAMAQSSRPLLPLETRRPLEEYDLVILGTPVWAGRCSSVVRSFLKAEGHRLQRVSFVLLRSGGNRCEEVYQQMDGYLPQGHVTAVSLQANSVGYQFWQEEFLRQTRAFLDQGTG